MKTLEALSCGDKIHVSLNTFDENGDPTVYDVNAVFQGWVDDGNVFLGKTEDGILFEATWDLITQE